MLDICFVSGWLGEQNVARPMSNVSVLWHGTSQWTLDVNVSTVSHGLSDSCDSMTVFEFTNLSYHYFYF